MTKNIGLALVGLLVLTLTSFAAEDSKSSIPQPGSVAPDFELAAVGGVADGKNVSLSQFRGKNIVVLYFYPRDNTPGCTVEAEKFKEDFSKFEKLGAVVLGVSVDDVKSHKSFVKNKELNFSLLSDVGGKVAKSYGVMGWIMAKRVTFVINKEGLVEKVFEDVKVDDHSKEVFKIVEKLSPKI